MSGERSAIVRRVDHLNIVVPKPRALFNVLAQRLQIPIERPWARFPAFESGQAMLGIGHEPITYAPGRQTGVPGDGFFAIAFEPERLELALPELSRRGIPHSIPFQLTVTYRDDPDALALDERAGPDTRSRRWALVTLGGFLGDRESERQLSHWPRRGDAAGAQTPGTLLGRLASGRLGGALMAQMASTRPFSFLCAFHSFDVANARAATAAELVRRSGGPLGLTGTREIVVGMHDLVAEAERWQRLLAPVQSDEPGHWKLGDGPAIRLVEAESDKILRVVWEVGSLSQTADWLRREGWIGAVSDDRISLAPEPLQGLEVQLAGNE